MVNLKYLKRLLALRLLRNKYPYYGYELASKARISVEDKMESYPSWMVEYFANDCSNYTWTMFLSKK